MRFLTDREMHRRPSDYLILAGWRGLKGRDNVRLVRTWNRRIKAGQIIVVNAKHWAYPGRPDPSAAEAWVAISRTKGLWRERLFVRRYLNPHHTTENPDERNGARVILRRRNGLAVPITRRLEIGQSTHGNAWAPETPASEHRDTGRVELQGSPLRT